jgi:ABC-2 type transport system ATP-binding protein
MMPIKDIEYAIETKNLTKKYDDFVAVDNLNLKIKKGEIFGFLGPNGAGKTTILNMIVGILNVTNGSISIIGHDIKSIKEKIGICPQKICLWENLTCNENLSLIGDMYEVPKTIKFERMQQLLKDLQLVDKKDSYVKTLSGGMQRRLNLAMALIHNPDIIVLDEPSAGLDPQSRLILWNYIQSLCKKENKTILLTTHMMEEAEKLSDRIAIMDKGKLLILDTPSNLKKQVGNGDILEIQVLDYANNQEIILLIKSHEEIFDVVEIENKIIIRLKNGMTKLPNIIQLIEKSGNNIINTSIRENTLEDVFIYLTGRGLRK